MRHSRRRSLRDRHLSSQGESSNAFYPGRSYGNLPRSSTLRLSYDTNVLPVDIVLHDRRDNDVTGVAYHFLVSDLVHAVCVHFLYALCLCACNTRDIAIGNDNFRSINRCNLSLLRYTERFRGKKIDTLKVDSANLIANKKKFNKCISNLERLLHRFREWNPRLKT